MPWKGRQGHLEGFGADSGSSALHLWSFLLPLLGGGILDSRRPKRVHLNLMEAEVGWGWAAEGGEHEGKPGGPMLHKVRGPALPFLHLPPALFVLLRDTLV